MTMLQILLAAFGLIALVLTGSAVLGGPSPSKEAGRRLRTVRERHSISANDKVEAQLRKAVAARRTTAYRTRSGSASLLKTLATRLHRTGKKWTVEQYGLACAGIAGVVAALVYLKTGSPIPSLLLGLLLGGTIPHMVVNMAIKRRVTAFTSKFPDAIELLVRGLRSGLPVGETLGVIGQEVPGPVGEEFKLVTERIRIGRTMEDALQDTADRLDTAEFSFFCITLAIQRETGGNLAETLANLAEVLRKRAQMKLKIRAMSSESKASAYIVGSLPFIVFGLIYWINTNYISNFFIDTRLMIVGGGGLVWMAAGGFIMAKMVSFEI